MLALEVALLSEPGGRSTNEDACGHWHSARRLCCVLADGAGGHGGGDVAARLAVRHVLDAFADSAVDGDGGDGGLAALVQGANRAVLAGRELDARCSGMHSTVVCLVVDFVRHTAEWAHAGDSRLYRFSGGRLAERTRDHSFVQSLVDAGLLDEAGMRSHARRSELRSALGVTEAELEVGHSGAPRPVAAGDAFLLCSDGIWEHLDEALLEGTLRGAASPDAWLHAIEAAVAVATRGRRSHDNFTAMAVWAAAA